MKTLLTKLIPAIATVCAILAAAPYELGEVATLIAPEWKPMILKISIAAYAVGRFVEWIAKTYFPELPVEKPKKPTILPLAILGALIGVGLFGCQTRKLKPAGVNYAPFCATQHDRDMEGFGK